MSRFLIYFFTFFIFNFSCSKKTSVENADYGIASFDKEMSVDEDLEEDNYPDGTYCVEVKYYNPNTGRESEYTLTADVENGEIVLINFPNGGYFDDEITDGSLDENGFASFTSYKGYEYEVQIIGDEGGCFEDVPMAEQCLGTTEEGDQCENVTDNPSGYCWQHEDQE